MGRRGVGDQAAFAHQQQVIAVVGFVHDVAGSQQGGPATGQLGELLRKIHPQYGVEPHRGLVENQQIRLADQGARQRCPGALAAGKVAAEGGSVIAEPDPLDRRIGGLAGHAVQGGEVTNVVVIRRSL